MPNNTKPEAPATEAPATNVTPVPANAPALGERNLMAAEEAKAYNDFGPLYAGVNVIGDLGVEIGFHTGEAKDGRQQRSGIGFYLRSDHMAKRLVPCII